MLAVSPVMSSGFIPPASSRIHWYSKVDGRPAAAMAPVPAVSVAPGVRVPVIAGLPVAGLLAGRLRRRVRGVTPVQIVRRPAGAWHAPASDTTVSKLSLTESVPSLAVTLTARVSTSVAMGVPEKVRVPALKLSQVGRAVSSPLVAE